MNGAVPPLPQYTFMAWCSLKTQGLIYLNISFYSLLHNIVSSCLLSINVKIKLCKATV
jgi:hypothetical protein